MLYLLGKWAKAFVRYKLSDQVVGFVALTIAFLLSCVLGATLLKLLSWVI